MYIETTKAMQIITIKKKRRIQTQSNIYDEVFFRKQLMFTIFAKKLHRGYVRLGSKYASERSSAKQLFSKNLHKKPEKHLKFKIINFSFLVKVTQHAEKLHFY